MVETFHLFMIKSFNMELLLANQSPSCVYRFVTVTGCLYLSHFLLMHRKPWWRYMDTYFWLVLWKILEKKFQIKSPTMFEKQWELTAKLCLKLELCTFEIRKSKLLQSSLRTYEFSLLIKFHTKHGRLDQVKTVWFIMKQKYH